MAMQLQRGQQVRVNAYGGKQPSVIVVEDRGNVVLICKPQEFEAARTEKREPISVGFRKEDVLLPKSASSEIGTENAKSKAGD
jgi:plastocyanin domain-containing protein